jgi:metal-sulfur cluster biosynthetic enzyme
MPIINLAPPEGSDHVDMFIAIQAQLETVYDPEFPVIDIWTLGLIYDITINEDENLIIILMTFTTPQCPMGDMIKMMTKNVIQEVYPDREVELSITFDPLWNPTMIRDQDLQRMFE